MLVKKNLPAAEDWEKNGYRLESLWIDDGQSSDVPFCIITIGYDL